MRILLSVTLLILSLSTIRASDRFGQPSSNDNVVGIFQLYLKSFVDPLAFEDFIIENRQALMNQDNKTCLKTDAGPNDGGYLESCIVRGESEYALICLNENPRVAVQLWSKSLYESIFSNIPWTETTMGRLARFNQLISNNSSARQSQYLLGKAQNLFPCQSLHLK